MKSQGILLLFKMASLHGQEEKFPTAANWPKGVLKD
ncbi:hypothetical protein PS907_05503 [Pseudomonas fluorescens]|nr:hypothetical protein PS907_05503 [Pseudomonas fluorescens]